MRSPLVQTDPLEWLLTYAVPAVVGSLALAIAWVARSFHTANRERLAEKDRELDRCHGLLDRANGRTEALLRVVAEQQRTIDRLTPGAAA